MLLAYGITTRIGLHNTRPCRSVGERVVFELYTLYKLGTLQLVDDWFTSRTVFSEH